MIKITTIASGSKGNCCRISNGKHAIMIECGIPFPKIQKAFNFRLSEVEGCLISHEHKDHCQAAVKMVSNGVKCYATAGTIEKMGIDSHRLIPIQCEVPFRIGSFTIYPFPTQHDAKEPCGFLIISGAEKVLFATDTYYIKPRFAGLTHIMIECNYSGSLLDESIENGDTHPGLKSRIIRSHFELENVKEFFRSNDLSKVLEIRLIHISKTNGNPEFFKKEIERLTGIPVIV